MKKNFLRLFVAVMAATMLLSLGACSKYKGYKKDKSGIYYKFYGDVHDTAYRPKKGDLVGVLVQVRTADSTIIPMSPQQMIIDSLYKGDLFDAIRLMHVEDSATFIMNGQEFFDKMFNQAQPWEFGEEPLYVDIKLLGALDKEKLAAMQAEYESEIEERRIEEIENIDEYLESHKTMKVNESGIYVEKIKAGKGAKAEPGRDVKVHYTGKFTNGVVFDSSVERGEPFVFTLGAGQVIPGWDAVVSQMQVGEKVKVLIPSGMAYGPQGAGNIIPPYTPLEFEIELLEVVK